MLYPTELQALVYQEYNPSGLGLSMGVPRHPSPEFARIYGIPHPPPCPAARSPSAASGRNQNLLAQRRGGAEKGKREPVSGSASLRLCASIIVCVSRPYGKPAKMTGILLDLKMMHLYDIRTT